MRPCCRGCRRVGHEQLAGRVHQGSFFAGYMAAVPCSPASPIAWTRGVYLVSSLVAAAARGFALLVVGVKSARRCSSRRRRHRGTYMPGIAPLTDNVEGTRAQAAPSRSTPRVRFGHEPVDPALGQHRDSMGCGPGVRADSVGPVVAGLMVVSASGKNARRRHEQHVLDFRACARKPRGTALHLRLCGACWSCFGSRSWLVASIVFARVCRSRDHVAGVVRRHIARSRISSGRREYLRQRAGDAPRRERLI